MAGVIINDNTDQALCEIDAGRMFQENAPGPALSILPAEEPTSVF